MKVSVEIQHPLLPEKIKTLLLAVGVWEKGVMAASVRGIDRATGKIISSAVRDREFTGKEGKTLLIHTKNDIAAKKVLVVGLGDKNLYSREKARCGFAKALTCARDMSVKDVHLLMESFGGKLSTEELARSAAEMAHLALYKYDRFKTEEPAEGGKINKVTLVVDKKAVKSVRAVNSAVRWGGTTAECAAGARDLANAPANVMTPVKLGQISRTLAKKYGLVCQVMGPAELKRQKMNGLLAVAAGSAQQPRFIVLEHRPRASKRTLVLVGKGVTFDSGGISIKPSQDMDKMKHDMAGAAAVIYSLVGVARLKLPIRVIGLVPATENLPGSKAARPGDIVKMASGKSVEVINTDAEGRIILADALFYGRRYRPDAMIDIATLTGACVVALGSHAIGMLGNDEKLMDTIREAGEAVWERVWPLPLWDDYFEQIKSEVADIKNVGNKGAGTIVGAMFLKQFVGDCSWVHLDIAGMAWVEKKRPYIPKGATGAGVRLFCEFGEV